MTEQKGGIFIIISQVDYIYSDLEICMISSLLHLNQLCVGGGGHVSLAPSSQYANE